MSKRVGQIGISGFGHWQIDYHCNDVVKESIIVRNPESLRDLQYVVNEAIRELEDRERKDRERR